MKKYILHLCFALLCFFTILPQTTIACSCAPYATSMYEFLRRYYNFTTGTSFTKIVITDTFSTPIPPEEDMAFMSYQVDVLETLWGTASERTEMAVSVSANFSMMLCYGGISGGLIGDTFIVAHDYAFDADTVFFSICDYMWKVSGDKICGWHRDSGIRECIELTDLSDSIAAMLDRVTSITDYQELDNSVTIFPNPTSGAINISNNDGKPILHLKVMDIMGRALKSVEGDGMSSVTLLHQTPGVYIVELKTAKGLARRKLIVQ